MLADIVNFCDGMKKTLSLWNVNQFCAQYDNTQVLRKLLS